ncbi:MAG: HIT domain-containing protein [Anaerolineales bacterium]|nr:HIT domain-containing protein [Anaerolineales bacterium]
MLRLFFRLLRRPVFYRIFIWMLKHLPFAIPVERLRQTEALLAFFHPRPAYPFHVLLIPRQVVRGLPDLDPADPFLGDLVAATQSLVAEYGLPAYRLIVNGGAHQEFPHLHFHLISDQAATRSTSAGAASPYGK